MSKSNYPKEFPCPTCGRFCKVGTTKKDKPYYVCDLCGVQVFIRAEDGIKRFCDFKNSELLKDLKGKNSLNTTELIRIKDRIEAIDSEIKELQSDKPFLIGTDKFENRINELNKIREELKTEYFQYLTI